MTTPGTITLTQLEQRGIFSPAALGRGGPAVTLRVLDAPKEPSSTFGGWQVVARKQAKGVLEWDGIEPVRLVFTGLLDGWRDGRSVETDIARLRNMALPLGADPPPAVRATGSMPAGMPKAWVIEALEPQDGALWDPTSSFRLRQAYAVTLLERVDDELVQERASDRARQQPGRQMVRPYVVKKGDTLARIAARELGSASKARDIAKLNPGTNDPRKALKAGTRLKLPIIHVKSVPA